MTADSLSEGPAGPKLRIRPQELSMTADSLSEGPAGPKLRIRPQELEEKPSEFRWSKGGKCVHQKAHRPARYRSVTEERR